MSETKFTPGPWVVFPARFPGIDSADGHTIIAFGDAEDEYMGVQASEPDKSEEEVNANACLIAAAPEMFAAGSRVLDYATLDTILADPKRHDNEVFGIRLGDLRPLAAALSKASGKGE